MSTKETIVEYLYCTKCHKHYPEDFFKKAKQGRSGRHSWCNSCIGEYNKNYYSRNREEENRRTREYRAKNSDSIKKMTKLYFDRNREAINKKARESRKFNRDLVMKALGGKCWCCGENELIFLAIDHINNDGVIDRKTKGAGNSFMIHIIKQGIPKDRYRILCHNCNMAVGILGYCPHHPIKTKRDGGFFKGVK